MINIVVKKGSPRISYICEIFFKYILKTEYQLFEELIFEHKRTKNNIECHINYTNNPKLNGLMVFNSGILESSRVENLNIDLNNNSNPKCFIGTLQTFQFDFDLFAFAFYFLTEYEKYGQQHFDVHHRYDENQYLVVKNNLNRKPWINIYVEKLWEALLKIHPELIRENSKFNYELTFDIDLPWAYLNKGANTYFGFFKDILKNDFKNLSNRFKSIKTANDPFFTFELIYKYAIPSKTTFFFLGNGESKYDNRWKFKDPAYSKLIKEIDAKSYSIGIHPSYLSRKNKFIIDYEKGELEKILNSKIVKSRQHYLRYLLPETYSNLNGIGIKHEYTTTIANSPGFKHLIATPFPWFDLLKNQMTQLMLHPTMAMDASYQYYLKTSPQEAIKNIFDLIDETKKVNGKFVMIWHNNSLSELNEWKNWSDVFIETTKHLELNIEN